MGQMESIDSSVSNLSIKNSTVKLFSVKLSKFLYKFNNNDFCNHQTSIKELIMDSQTLQIKHTKYSTKNERISSEVIDSDWFNTSGDILPLSPPHFSEQPEEQHTYFLVPPFQVQQLPSKIHFLRSNSDLDIVPLSQPSVLDQHINSD